MGMKMILLCCFLAASPLRITGMPQPAPHGASNLTSSSDLTASESNSNPSISQAPLFDDSDMYMEPQEPNEPREAQSAQVEQQTEPFKPSELEGGSQTFYPSFLNFNNQPLGHSRPFYYPQQEAAYSQRPSGAYRQQQLTFDNNIKYNNPFRRENYQTAAAADNSAALLGSGNFGVIRGGTFYNENDEKNDFSGRYNNYSPFYHNNGHGRPSFYFGATNPRPTQHEQFANFRDFADINTPNPAYSEYVVVYINKNGSAVEEHPRKIAAPKNIIERLAMLDLENNNKKATKEEVPPKKLSLSKRKLALLTPEKKYKVKKSTSTTIAPTSSDLYEPLLALS